MNKPYTEGEFLSIKEWAEDDRPREKLISKGKSALSDAELMAILIGSGSRNESAVKLSQRILQSSQNNLFELSRLTVKELCKFKGVGEAKAVSIIAALELGLRQKASKPAEKPKIGSSRDAYIELENAFSEPNVEEFHLLLLSQSNQVLGRQFISRGGITGTVADVRVIARSALEGRAVGVIIAHNHPSANLKPSQSDLQLTQKIKQALAVFDIKLLDHLILGGNSYYSFADEGVL